MNDRMAIRGVPGVDTAGDVHRYRQPASACSLVGALARHGRRVPGRTAVARFLRSSVIAAAVLAGSLVVVDVAGVGDVEGEGATLVAYPAIERAWRHDVGPPDEEQR
jgi:hypothetical protein